ncbi:hypothetical protein PAPHI01_0988 [Pancytospora philotis]|nr:hypothetical protein PAPHI01_0988 [Pancytospora philotis]
MFMFLLKPLLRMRARDITFRTVSYDLSEEVHQSYYEIKQYYKHLLKGFIHAKNDVESAPYILKEFLHFYLKCETFGLSLVNEIFKPHFVDSIGHRKAVFEMLNKLMKIFMSIDLLRLRHPEIFCSYSAYKLKHGDAIHKICSEFEDQRISILSSIPLPMGRLVLSFFASDKFELYYPTILSKRMRISLNKDAKKNLYIYARLMELNDFKYLHVYLGAVYKKFYGKNSYTFDPHINELLDEYLVMLQEHN